ncbi:hypothetical protein ABW21_db0206847 [Orbilia brochopaga]|nr:hypothetical protein ABW21_db0206847 [Drechslerella brochopaga]
MADGNADTEPHTRPPVICHFYFKKGEQDIEKVRSGLESVLYQLLDANELRRNTGALVTVIDILNPSFGESDSQKNHGKGNANFLDNHKSLCETIRAISVAIPSRVYIMFDALDECQDRREQEFLKLLHSLIKASTMATTTQSSGGTGLHGTATDNPRVIISCRDNIDITREFSDGDGESSEGEALLPQGVRTIEITSEKNSNDLREFITHDVGELLTRRIDRKRFTSFFQQELSRIAEIIHQKAKGDFTLARMIIANLQQPSKETLDKRIQQLPSAIGDIYMASLESLTPDEQELIVSTLKWVVWGVSGINVIEISDHYRDLYRVNAAPLRSLGNGVEDISGERAPTYSDGPREGSNTSAVESQPVYSNPYDDPEIKDIMYHIENAGRDFFKFDRNTGLVSVDISIREWIQEDGNGSKSAIMDSRGFKKYRDPKGNTVFKFTLTPSFVRYGDSLSELFNEREAQMSITVDILRSLNNEIFQSKYMTWEPDWIPGKPKQQRRYEIDHWQDHIRIMQKWWNDSSLDDNWWSELLTQLSIFTRPENWYFWNLQREFKTDKPWDEDRNIRWKEEYLIRLFTEPIHVACEFGLTLLIDMLVRDSRKLSPADQQSGHDVSRVKLLRTKRAEAFAQQVAASSRFKNKKPFLQGMDREEILELLRRRAVETDYEREENRLRTMIYELDVIHPEDCTDEEVPICDKADVEEQTPLYIAASNPNTLERLLWHRADINKVSTRTSRAPYIGDPDSQRLHIPLLAIVQDVVIAAGWSASDDKTVRPLLQSAEKLVERATAEDLQARYLYGETLLHMAAAIRNFQFFKLLCLSGDWDIHVKDSNGKNPMHHLFDLTRPKGPSRIQEVLSICQMMLKMRRPDGDDLVNTEDSASTNPLAYAVRAGFKEAVELLINLGADVHDESSYEDNCFHHLGGSPFLNLQSGRNSEMDLDIANILLRAGVNCARKNSKGQTPLFRALQTANWHLVPFFLKIYNEMGHNSIEKDGNPLLVRDENGQTLLHYAVCQVIRSDEIEAHANNLREVSTVLSGHTSIQEFVQLADNFGKTALHFAVSSRNLEAIRFIAAINPNRGFNIRDAENCAAIDIAVEELRYAESSMGQGFPGADVLVELCTETFYILLSLVTPSEFSFSFLDIKAWPGKELILRRLGLEKLVTTIESQVSSKDLHGWSLFDMLYAIDAIGLFNPYLTQKELSPADNFAKSSKIGWTSLGAELSNNGIDFYLPEDDWEHNFVIAMADHPVPFIDWWFYFEVGIIEPTGVEIYGPGINCKIGVRAETGMQEFVMALMTSGFLEIDGQRQPWMDSLRSIYGEPGLEDGPSKDISNMGCGINPMTRGMFFTANGKLVVKAASDGDDGQSAEGITDIPYGRYFPAFACYSPEGQKFKINFGAERFVFEPANDPDWQFRRTAPE